MTPGLAGAALLAVGCAALAVVAWRARREAGRLRERLAAATDRLEQLQHALSGLAPSEVVDRLAAGGPPPTGERREVTVLFADLVGFTALSERVPAEALVEILNGYFERMSRAIVEHRGRISTLIGDGILALFGAFEHNPWQGDDAVRAALAMRAALADYNAELAARGHPQIAIGIGVHRGVGVAGLVGSRERKDYAVVGGPVNVAARVQDLTRRTPADILVTEGVRRTLDPRFRLRELPPAELKGIAEPVRVWAVEGEGAGPRGPA